MKHVIQNEPVLVTNVVLAILALLVGAGLVTDQIADGVAGISFAVLALLSGVIARSAVTPASKDRRDPNFRA